MIIQRVMHYEMISLEKLMKVFRNRHKVGMSHLMQG